MTTRDFDAGFSATVWPAFENLIRYGFSDATVHYSGDASTPQFDVLATFINKHTNTAVDVNWDVRSAEISVGVYKLDNGRIPRRRSFYGVAGTTPIIELFTFLRLKFGKNCPPIPNCRSTSGPRRKVTSSQIDKRELKSVLRQYATLLLNEAKEVIDGDFSTAAAVQSTLRKSMGLKLTRDKSGIVPS